MSDTKFTLIVCTYKRPEPLLKLLNSVKKQALYPSEILIVDGSIDDKTERLLVTHEFQNLKYYKVEENERGLTKQRNFGIEKVDLNSEIVCFLDDDTELDRNYFKAIIDTFKNDSNCVGVGGVAVNENRWFKIDENQSIDLSKHYVIDGYAIKESSRNLVRNKLGLQSPFRPGIMPDFSHGRTYSYPLNNKIYPVDLLIGMSFNFRKSIFKHIKFSIYFEGYGLYEDADFSLRALRYGTNVINTAAKLNHYHNISGRPNKYKYGKMVVKNGWYVWRVKYPNPTIRARIKWHTTSFLLTIIRFTNVINTNQKKEALTESMGRVVGWWSLFFNKPKVHL
ncbi:glycosyltransferase family 2 protein [Aequorivita marisscotiae]|uniref:Glycosyltransferase n=1 Tax=Aequorivita marisscotiae TaxID=3040348 RepID=A0ABY8KTH5_9FLAO|nr:glycosyltransferase [Aequorivita sp. Ant34-E75]WGF92731.1 glycosyltransferase [Aequorivita sp. Ant34-E75]